MYTYVCIYIYIYTHILHMYANTINIENNQSYTHVSILAGASLVKKPLKS